MRISQRAYCVYLVDRKHSVDQRQQKKLKCAKEKSLCLTVKRNSAMSPPFYLALLLLVASVHGALAGNIVLRVVN